MVGHCRCSHGGSGGSHRGTNRVDTAQASCGLGSGSRATGPCNTSQSTGEWHSTAQRACDSGRGPRSTHHCSWWICSLRLAAWISNLSVAIQRHREWSRQLICRTIQSQYPIYPSRRSTLCLFPASTPIGGAFAHSPWLKRRIAPASIQKAIAHRHYPATEQDACRTVHESQPRQ